MTKTEAKQFLQASIDGLQHLSIKATKENVAYLDGTFNILEELKANIDNLTAE